MRKHLNSIDAITSFVLLAATGLQVVMREWYHQTGSQASNITLWLGWLTALVTVLALGPRTLPVRFHAAFSRGVLLLSAAISAYILIGGVILAALNRAGLSRYWLVACLVLLLVLLFLARSIALHVHVSWAMFRIMLLVASILFTVSQPILVTMFTPNLEWPMNERAATQPVVDTPFAVIFLLLDEMNASSAAPFVDILKAQGLQVRFKGVKPVADATAKVIPAMFSGKDFSQARPCGWTAICSGLNVLDFAHITANRDDVDVVGFYHPYCAIRSLRWCKLLGKPLSLLDPEQWQCALWRHTGWSSGLAQSQCNKFDSKGRHGEMMDDVASALWQAPFWEQGGFLFAHLPLPHPPGSTAGASLQTHYAENTQRAVRLVSEMVTRARKVAPNDVRIVIFSDHPLRQALWCHIYEPYTAQGCTPVKELVDLQVPLIVAGDRVPSIDGISNNAQVFRLASSWK